MRRPPEGAGDATGVDAAAAASGATGAGGGVLLRRFLVENRRGLVGWALAMVALCLLYLPLYSVMGTDALDEAFRAMPESMRQAFGITGTLDGIGYAQSTLYSFTGSLLIIIAAIGWGTRAIAGDEEAGGLELTLAHAVRRGPLMLQRALALAIQVLVLAFVVVGALVLLSGPAKIGVLPANALAAGAGQAGLGLLMGGVALAVGGLTGRRSAATAVAVAVVAAAYVGDVLGGQVAGLAWLQGISPLDWAYGADPLRNGADLGRLARLYGAFVILVALAWWGLRRRDVGVG